MLPTPLKKCLGLNNCRVYLMEIPSINSSDSDFDSETEYSISCGEYSEIIILNIQVIINFYQTLHVFRLYISIVFPLMHILLITRPLSSEHFNTDVQGISRLP